MFFVTANLRPSVRRFSDSEYPLIHKVVEASRERLGYLLYGYVLRESGGIRGNPGQARYFRVCVPVTGYRELGVMADSTFKIQENDCNHSEQPVQDY
jgi:hypothetical protein